MMTTHERTIALTIAGSDSGGGAGIQADLKTFHTFGVFGTSAITAITAQNTVGVRAVHAIPLADVRAQIDAVAEDLRPAAFKTGMLATKALVRTVSKAIQEHGLTQYVMDPVMVATSGDRLLDEDAVAALRETLLPLATLITPNLPEAAILTGLTIESVEDMHAAATRLVEMGAGAALVKGGHLDGDVVDVLYDGRTVRSWSHPRIDTRHTHGTGCTLSAAIVAGLAKEATLEESVEASITWTTEAIASAPGLGSGHGPVNHFAIP